MACVAAIWDLVGPLGVFRGQAERFRVSGPVCISRVYFEETRNTQVLIFPRGFFAENFSGKEMVLCSREKPSLKLHSKQGG